ncbi:hypothetical protein WA026_015824 [Henosepilachna vigintioctopunctata]|uniref:Reverse transcriptase domain-containing protein n=1 Tax=Henosepilachna vigintioctopunctata TaxID=420089 RepID=A0AAW1UTZ8_9CUCU
MIFFTQITIQFLFLLSIIRASKKLKNKFTSGVDHIPSFLVKDCIHSFAKPLSLIFNIILRNILIPKIWKVTKICPVLKSGDAALITNYRPIAILCNFAKIFEIILYDSIYRSVRTLVSPHQHGFMKNRSTVTNLACITHSLSETLNDRGQIDVIYTDIQKAFDQIDHRILLSKLKAIGFSSQLLNLMQSYFSDRFQYVKTWW